MLNPNLDEIQLTKDDYERYSRHLILPEVGLEGQKRLKAASVMCIGTGGLGSPLLLYLAAAGIGDASELSILMLSILLICNAK
ncbi:hypothetical protein NSTCB13_02833 [Nostoc sp. DSM 114160]|jgi:molybdopterin/thiamine biosynthesis adenylyltransferase